MWSRLVQRKSRWYSENHRLVYIHGRLEVRRVRHQVAGNHAVEVREDMQKPAGGKAAAARGKEKDQLACRDDVWKKGRPLGYAWSCFM